MSNSGARISVQGDALSRHTSVLGDSREPPRAQPAWGHPSVSPFPHQGKRFERMWGTQIFTTCSSACAELGERALTGRDRSLTPVQQTRSHARGKPSALAEVQNTFSQQGWTSVAAVMFLLKLRSSVLLARFSNLFFFPPRKKFGVSFII